MARRKSAILTFLLCGLIVVFDGTSGHVTDHQTDFRIINYEDLLASERLFQYSNDAVEGFVQLTIDIPRQQLLLGAKNHLLRLDLGNLEELEKVDWSPTKLNQSICRAKGRPEEDCQNFVRVLILHKNRVFACGTNAFNPSCTWRQSTHLSEIHEWTVGVGKCPYDPNYNNTALMTSDGNLYSGTAMDFVARDPAIYRIMGPAPHLRTLQYNSKWLNEPDFVSSYEIDGFIYFFFRESAVEYINCGKTIYSRVARICKNDAGGNFLLEDNWTTFMKARLNCSIPGQYPFYFNELQSTWYDESRGVIYGIFSTSPSGIHGSAVCTYNMSSFNTAFSGPFKYQENAERAWTRVPNTAPPLECGSQSSAKRSLIPNAPAQHHLVNAQKFQMLDDAVQPTIPQPLLVAEHHRFTHIIVDRVRAKHHENFDIMFVATLEGVIRKMTQIPSTGEICLIEELHVVPEGHREPIKSMQLLEDQGVLFISTNNRVLKIPVQRCSRFKTRESCINAQDPYCGWHSNLFACAPIPASKPYHNWHQDITGCPRLEMPVDGEWSEWNDWDTCAQHGSNGADNTCKCRYHTCTNPAPQFGGRPCEGEAVEVTNCTTHGGWTEWSEWSSCTATCGVAMKSRRRTCSNPQPRFGGRVCVGTAISEDYCHTLPACPLPQPDPIDGVWSIWSDWSECTAKCSGGIQERYRRCDNPSPSRGGRECIGNYQEWRVCNSHKCQEVRKSSDWTNWMRMNSSRDGYSEQRFRYVCRAHVPDHRDLRVTSVRTDTRFCPLNSDICTSSDEWRAIQNASPTTPDVDGIWSQWTTWTRCDKVCGSGYQWRERACSEPSPSGNGKDCIGHGREARECNIHACQGVWSMWTEFGACSVTCGQGLRWRSRQCQAQAPGKQYTKPCYGSDREEAVCRNAACSRFDGWEEWTLWSICGPSNTQTRKRGCRLPFPSNDQCQGPKTEDRMCRYNVIAELQSDEVSSQRARNRGFTVLHLVVVGFLGFLLGGLVCVGVFIYIKRWKKENDRANNVDDENYDTLNKLNANQNFYSGNSQGSVEGSLNNKMYNSGSLKPAKDPSKMTVKEATMRRNSMRTNLSINDL